MTRKEEIKAFVKELFERRLNDTFVDAHEKFETGSGDIAPEQQLYLDNLTEQMIDLITKQVDQNLPDIKPFSREVEEVKPADMKPEEKDLYDSRTDGTPIKTLFRCKETGWSYVQYADGNYHGLAMNDDEYGDREKVIKFLQENF